MEDTKKIDLASQYWQKHFFFGLNEYVNFLLIYMNFTEFSYIFENTVKLLVWWPGKFLSMIYNLVTK